MGKAPVIRSKNIYNVLEKVKKGEFKSYYSSKDSLFGKINFYKRPDLIKPHLHYLDEYRLENIMESHFDNKAALEKGFEKFKIGANYKAIAADKKPDFDSYCQRMKRVFKEKFPQHIVNDIFKMYYNKIEHLEFEPRTDKNHPQFKLLEKSNNPVGKIMSESNPLKSAIFTRAMVEYFVSRLVQLEFTNPDEARKLQKNLEECNEFDKEETENSLEKIMENAASKRDLDDLLDKAMEVCKTIDKTIDSETQKQMFETSDENKESGKLDAGYLTQLSNRLENIQMSLGSLKQKIKHLLNKSVSYFNSKSKVIFEDIFNADSVVDINDEVLLHPKLRNIFMEDIMVKDSTSVGKIDVYVDISGSMSGSCGVVNDRGASVNKMDFAKSLVFKMKQMDILNDLYSFNTSVKKMKSDIISIALLNDSGGTTINNAIRMINKNQNNALIITDAEDGCNEYSDKAFFIGVKGCSFNHFHRSTLSKYIDNDQIIVFEGDRILKVNKDGNPIY